MFFLAILIESKEYRIITNMFEYWIYDYIYVFEWDIFFGLNYDLIYMILDNLTMFDFDTQSMGVIHWYSDIQTNGGYSLVLRYSANEGYSLVLWYLNQWGLFISTLIPTQWGLFIGILISKPMGIIHWYSDAQSRGYIVTIVIRLLRIWITFEYLNHFESLKLHM